MAKVVNLNLEKINDLYIREALIKVENYLNELEESDTNSEVISLYLFPQQDQIPALSAVSPYQENSYKRISLSGSIEDARCIGVIKDNSTIGQSSEVVCFGTLEDDSFNFNSGAILYANNNGTITATAPASGPTVEIGFGLGRGRIFVFPRTPY